MKTEQKLMVLKQQMKKKRKIDETESQFFENLYKNDKPLSTLKWKRNQGQKLPV